MAQGVALAVAVVALIFIMIRYEADRTDRRKEDTKPILDALNAIHRELESINSKLSEIETNRSLR